jgi:uncharacterized protein YukE
VAGGFQVNPEDIGKSAKSLLSAGQSLAGDVAAFQSQTAALNHAFGDDDLGSALGMIYEAASQAAFDCFHDNAEGIKEIGQNLQAMADTYSEIDSAHRDSLQQLLGGLA